MQCVALYLERNYRQYVAAICIFSGGYPWNNVIAEHFKMHSKPTIDRHSKGQSQSYVTRALKYPISSANPLFVPFCGHSDGVFPAQRASNAESFSMPWCHNEIAIRYLRYCGHVMVRNHHFQYKHFMATREQQLGQHSQKFNLFWRITHKCTTVISFPVNGQKSTISSILWSPENQNLNHFLRITHKCMYQVNVNWVISFPDNSETIPISVISIFWPSESQNWKIQIIWIHYSYFPPEYFQNVFDSKENEYNP